MLERFPDLVRFFLLTTHQKGFRNFKIASQKRLDMIQREELEQILNFVSKRWIEITKDPENKAMGTLPSNFWMNSIGGKAGKGRWVTMLMYTESEADAEVFKGVLLNWQNKGTQGNQSPDLIKIGKKK